MKCTLHADSLRNDCSASSGLSDWRLQKDKGEFMETIEIKLREEYIKLGQALKAAGIAQSGVDAKLMIQDGEALVNGAVEYQRGKKLYDGDEVVCQDTKIRIVK